MNKAEFMAVEMRRSKRKDLIAYKRALRNTQTTEDQPACAMCGGRKEDSSLTNPMWRACIVSLKTRLAQKKIYSLPYSD